MALQSQLKQSAFGRVQVGTKPVHLIPELGGGSGIVVRAAQRHEHVRQDGHLAGAAQSLLPLQMPPMPRRFATNKRQRQGQQVIQLIKRESLVSKSHEQTAVD